MVVQGTGKIRFREAFAGNAGVGELKAAGRTLFGTPPELSERYFVSGRVDGKLAVAHSKVPFTSCGTSVCGRRYGPVHKKIIGRGMSVVPYRFRWRNVLARLLWALPLFDEPASQHGRGIFLDPKIEKSPNFLAEVGGMAEARKFVALQRVSRSRKKKLPRWLGAVVVHKGSPGKRQAQINSTVIVVKSTDG